MRTRMGNTGLKLHFLRRVTFLSGVCRAIATFRQVVAWLILQVFRVAVETSAPFWAVGNCSSLCVYNVVTYIEGDFNWDIVPFSLNRPKACSTRKFPLWQNRPKSLFIKSLLRMVQHFRLTNLAYPPLTGGMSTTSSPSWRMVSGETNSRLRPKRVRSRHCSNWGYWAIELSSTWDTGVSGGSSNVSSETP